MSIAKYIHCFAINKYTSSFLITKLTTDHWLKPQSGLVISRCVSFLRLGIKEHLLVRSMCLDTQNQRSLILLAPLFQSPVQDQQNGKQTLKQTNKHCLLKTNMVVKSSTSLQLSPQPVILMY